VESELEKVRTETERLTEELHQCKSSEHTASEALELEKSKVIELKREVDRLSAKADTSHVVAKV